MSSSFFYRGGTGAGVAASPDGDGGGCQQPVDTPHSAPVPASPACLALGETLPHPSLPPTAGLLEKPRAAWGGGGPASGRCGPGTPCPQGAPDCSWPGRPALSSLPLCSGPFDLGNKAPLCSAGLARPPVPPRLGISFSPGTRSPAPGETAGGLHGVTKPG